MRRIRIVAKGPLFQGAQLLDADTGEDLGLRMRALTVPRGTTDDLMIAHVELIVDELDLVVEDRPLPPPDVLHIEAGDVLVMQLPFRTPPTVLERMRQQLGERFPGHEVVFLEGGLRLTVARPVAPAPRDGGAGS